jgi:hypothetical protein
MTTGSASRRHTGIVPLLALLLAVALAGCGMGAQPEPTTPPSPTQDSGKPTAAGTDGTATVGGTSGINDTQSLVDALTRAGMVVNPTGPIEQPFLSVKGSTYEAGSGYMQVFEYADQSAADSDAAKISPDGSIAGFSVGWVASPHFYKVGRLIVIYLGDDATDLGTLQTTLGDPFASGKAPLRP